MTQEEAEAFVKAVYPESVVEPAELLTDWWRIWSEKAGPVPRLLGHGTSALLTDWRRLWSEKAGPVPRLLGHGSTVAEAWGDAAKRMAMRVAGGCPE